VKLSTKLYTVVGSLALTGMLVAGVGVWYLRTMGEALSVATDRTAIGLDLINASRARAWEMVAAVRGVFFFANRNDQAAVDASVRQWDAAFKRAGEQIAQIKPLLTSEEGKANLARFQSALGEFQGGAAEFERLCQEHKFGELSGASLEVQKFADLSDEALGNLKVQERNSLKESQARSKSLQSQSLWIGMLMGCLLPAIAALAVFQVRNTVRTLARAISETSDTAGQLALAATQISSASQSLAQGSSQQAAAIEETSASSEEINSMACRNTESSRTAAGLVSASLQKFAQTKVSLDRMVVAMGEIKTHSGKISKIIKAIDEIAFQTNILALNAAVEAARAGESGMGFAVVADEVRNLAQRCAQAARDTAELIEESIAKSNDGNMRVDEVAVAIRENAGEAAKVKTLVEEVSQGSQDQTRGIEQVSRAIAQMQQVTQQTAAHAEESAAASAELHAQSETLRQIVGRLAAMVTGSAISNARGRHAITGAKLLVAHR
jgi:methyl-accepting chemotaxis protein/methyl-accepting chemotaxis protein-1 (serine sensor receptor)